MSLLLCWQTNIFSASYRYQPISSRRNSISFCYYLHHQFFNQQRLWAGHQKIPAQQKALDDGQKWPHCASQYSLHKHWRPRMTAFGFHQIQIIHLTLCNCIQLAKAWVILNSVHRIGAWHPVNIPLWATFFHHWVWRNSMTVVRKYFLCIQLITKFIVKIFSGVSDAVLWLYSLLIATTAIKLRQAPIR